MLELIRNLLRLLWRLFEGRPPVAVEASCTNEQAVKFIAADPRTATGRPAQLDANNPARVRVVSGDGTAISDPGLDGNPPDPRAVYVISGAAAGDVVAVMEADADLTSGEALIPETLILHVSQALASNLGVVSEAAIDKARLGM